jgi:hypothetical protein
VPPTPVRLTRRALEGGAGGTLEYLPRAYAGPRRDVRPVESVIPVAVNPVRPSPLMLLHAGHCGDIPTLLRHAGTRYRHNGHSATYGPPSTAPSNWPTTAAGQPTTTSPPSKPLLYEHRMHHDTSTGAGFARTAVSSTALLAIPPHVGKQCGMHVNCPLLGLQKEGQSPSRRGHGTTDSYHSHALHLLHDIGTRLNQTSGTWRPRLLSRLTCSHPSTSSTVQAIQCPEHTTAGRTAPAGTRINQVSLVA